MIVIVEFQSVGWDRIRNMWNHTEFGVWMMRSDGGIWDYGKEG